MPFKVIAGLKKITSIDAEIVASAQLSSDRVFAALSNDPVRLMVVPFSGSGHKVTNVSLDDVNDLALINKSVAVVRASDQLWALLDIQHSAKIEQAGSEIGKLCARPKGSSAWAAGWGGQGADLKLQGHEVNGRQFQLRGDHRAVCIGNDDMTHTVVAQGVGGQYRQHPGPTPEPAPSGRADLPDEAKGLNRLAGGVQLSAVWKKGSTQICAVRAEGGNHYGAKMVNVDSGAAGVAVIESSLFVVCADGDLRLYNSGTLQDSVGDTMAPTHQLNLRTMGEPTTLLATTKGGNRLWVGTKEGEIVRCDVVKKGLDF